MRKVSLVLILTMLVALLTLPLDIQAFKMNKKVGALVEQQDRAVATNLGLYGGKANDVAIDATSNNVYMTTMAPNGFFISTDNGINWSGLPDSVNYGTGTAVEVDSSGNVYAIIGDDLIKSSNGGSSFSEITSRVGNGLGSVLLFAQSKLLVGISGGVAISSNGGTSFSKATIESGAMIRSFTSSPTSGTFYSVASQGNNSEKLYKSTDGGSSWSDMNFHSAGGVPAGQRIDVVVVNPANANHIIISQTGGASANSLQTFDGGNTWAQVVSGGQNVSSNHITFDGTGRVYMLKSYSTDNGTSWTSLNNNTPSSTLYSDTMAIDPGNPNLIFTNSGMGIARSTDRGLNWTDSINGVTSVKTYDIAQADSKKYVWIGADGGLGRTTNFTSNSPDWQYPIVSGFQGSTVFAVWIKPNNPDIVVSGDGQFIRRTTNATASNPSSVSWSQVAEIVVPGAATGGGNVVEIASHPTNDNLLYAAHTNDDRAGSDTGAVLKSEDAGATWTNLNIPGNVPATSLTVAKDGDVYVGTGGDSSTGVYKYSGGSWTKLSGGFPAQKVTSVLADPENANNILATTADNGNLFRSTNGGSSWTKITNGLSKVNNLDSLTVQTSTTPNTFYVAGQDQSGGISSLNGAIYKSADGGQTWGQYYVGLKQESFYAMLFDGLTAGNDRGLFEIKSKASVGLKAKPKTVKKGKIVKLIVSLKDAATKKKLKKRTVLLYKKVIVKKKVKKKWKNIAKWKLIKKAKLNKKGEVVVKTKLGVTTVYLVKWKPGKSDKEEYTTSKSKSLKVKVKK